MSDRVNWFIPARRAVVRTSLTMGELIEEWIQEVDSCRGALFDWYGLSEPEVTLGLGEVDRWLSFELAGGIDLVRDGEGVIDEPLFHFKPRLWKGPARVLLETGEDPRGGPQETIWNPPVTEGEFGVTLTEDREVDSISSVLLMGDVLELPLFKLLGACGLEEYGTLPRYDDVYRFQPEGSYLLGTSLRLDGVEDPLLPENPIGMRFQLVLGLFYGSFYHTSPVYLGADEVPFAATPVFDDPAPEPSVDPVENPATPLDELRRDIGELLHRVDIGPSNVYLEGLNDVDEDPRGRIEAYAHTGQSGSKTYHPARSVPFIISDWVKELYDGQNYKELSPATTYSIAKHMAYHDRFVTAFEIFIEKLDALTKTDPWNEHEKVGPDFKSEKLRAKMEKALADCGKARVVKCNYTGCAHEHARAQIADLIVALREKREALDRVANPDVVDIRQADLGPGVYARGLLYCGTPFGPCDGKSDAWRWYTNGWCRTSEADRLAPTNLPTVNGLAGLPKDQPVTPGTVCSPATLWLCNYMVRNFTYKTWGANAVSTTIRKNNSAYPITEHFTYHPHEELAAIAPVVTADQQQEELEAFLEEVREFHADIAERERMFWAIAFDEERETEAWKTHVSSKTDALLEKWAGKAEGAWRAPVYFTKHLAAAIKKAGGAERDALMALHQRLVDDGKTLAARWNALLVSAGWQTFAGVGEAGKSHQERLETAAKLGPLCAAGGFGGDSKKRQTYGYAIHKMWYVLRDKKNGLEKLAAHPERIKDVRGGMKDLTGFFSDINAVSYGVHELGVVKVYDARRLFDHDLGTAGFMTAFHPLSGEPQADPSMTDGQLYMFEATGSYPNPFYIDGKKYRQYGSGPFVWRKVTGNLFDIQFKGKVPTLNEHGQTKRGAIRSVCKLREPTTLETTHRAGPPAARPILFHPSPRSLDKAINDARKIGDARIRINGNLMYESRALPFPTLKEAEGAFADHAEVAAHIQRFY